MCISGISIHAYISFDELKLSFNPKVQLLNETMKFSINKIRVIYFFSNTYTYLF